MKCAECGTTLDKTESGYLCPNCGLTIADDLDDNASRNSLIVHLVARLILAAICFYAASSGFVFTLLDWELPAFLMPLAGILFLIAAVFSGVELSALLRER